MSAQHTPGPWVIGSVWGQHLRPGEERCHYCDGGHPLVKVTKVKPGNPQFTDTVHWHLNEGREGGDEYPSFRTIVSADDGTEIIGNYDYEEGGVCTHWADARLIAAAPDLLEALTTIADELQAWESSDTPRNADWASRRIRLAREAIARAQPTRESEDAR